MARIFVCQDSALPEGEGIKLDTPTIPIAVFKLKGELHALSDRCSHGNASMSTGFVDDDGSVECPLHAARFCLKTGAALCQPATEPLRTFVATRVEGAIYVDVPDA
jgi:3-phenylpropionate/trans-cinnamate dioxygenase ferredoxin subunit